MILMVPFSVMSLRGGIEHQDAFAQGLVKYRRPCGTRSREPLRHRALGRGRDLNR
jgi:hypothetical protein